MTTAPLLGLICMVNSCFAARRGVRLVRVTVISTCSPGSTISPEPINHSEDQEHSAVSGSPSKLWGF